jgi:hypothetical protein
MSDNQVHHPANVTLHNPPINRGPAPLDNHASPAGPANEPPVLPHSILYSRSVPSRISSCFLPNIDSLPQSLTHFSSLLTLSWFLTAHILEYTSTNTCRHTSPHLWWLVFGILCTMYLMVLEVVLLGFAVLVVAPIIFVREYFYSSLCRKAQHKIRYSGMYS